DALPELNRLLKPIFKAEVFTDKSNDTAALGFSSTRVKRLLYSPFEGQINTGKMLRNLLAYISRLGVHIITGARVFGFVENADGLQLEVQESVPGRMLNFRTQQLAVCTN